VTPEQLAPALATVLTPSLGSVRIDELRVLTGGASRATWAFDAVTEAGSRTLILRIGPPDEIHAGMELEAAALTRAATAGAPVPAVLVADNSTDALGNPFLVCDFIGGETIVRRILRAIDDDSRADLVTQCANALAAIHRADPTGIGLASSDPLDDWHAQLDEMGDTTATFEWTFRWLARNRPPSSPNVLVHGDFRMGNLIIDTTQHPARLAAVLDWELTHAGEVYEDLAWFCIRAWRFGAPRALGAGGLGSIENFLLAYEHASGTVLDRAAMHWWLVLSTLRWGVICRYQAERHLSGQTRSAELAAIGRRVSETEFDLLTLLAPHPGISARPVAVSATERAEITQSLYGRPTAAELVAAVAEFLEKDVRDATGPDSRLADAGAVNFHARVAANVLRTVERERLDDSPAPDLLGFPDEATLAAAIRRGDLDDRGTELLSTLRDLVLYRLAVSHPGYEHE
jgi:aminoglycoside phosphotransferase (APT) family kinase protein